MTSKELKQKGKIINGELHLPEGVSTKNEEIDIKETFLCTDIKTKIQKGELVILKNKKANPLYYINI